MTLSAMGSTRELAVPVDSESRTTLAVSFIQMLIRRRLYYQEVTLKIGFFYTELSKC